MTELEKLENRLDELDIEYDKILSSLFGNAVKTENWPSLKQLEEATKEVRKEISNISYLIKKIEPLKWEEIPDYGDKMPIEEWKECVLSGGFIDYDGGGNYASDTLMSNKTVSPSNLKNGLMLDNKEFTHIIWFNR